MEKDKLDSAAIRWLIDCTMADARNERVSRFSDFIEGKHPKDLTMEELLALNPVAKILMENLIPKTL